MRNVKYWPLYLIKSKFTGEYYTCIKLDVFVSNVTFDLYTKQHDINNYRYSWTPPPEKLWDPRTSHPHQQQLNNMNI